MEDISITGHKKHSLNIQTVEPEPTTSLRPVKTTYLCSVFIFKIQGIFGTIFSSEILPNLLENFAHSLLLRYNVFSLALWRYVFFIVHRWDTWHTWWCHTGRKTTFLPVKTIKVSVKEQFSVAEWVGTFLLKPQSVLPERLPVIYLFRCLWLQRRSLTASIKHSAAAGLRWPRAATPARVSLGRADGQGGRLGNQVRQGWGVGLRGVGQDCRVSTTHDDAAVKATGTSAVTLLLVTIIIPQLQ